MFKTKKQAKIKALSLIIKAGKEDLLQEDIVCKWANVILVEEHTLKEINSLYKTVNK